MFQVLAIASVLQPVTWTHGRVSPSGFGSRLDASVILNADTQQDNAAHMRKNLHD